LKEFIELKILINSLFDGEVNNRNVTSYNDEERHWIEYYEDNAVVYISNIDPGQKIQVIRDRIIKYHSLIEEKTENIKYLLFFSGDEDINLRFIIIHAHLGLAFIRG